MKQRTEERILENILALFETRNHIFVNRRNTLIVFVSDFNRIRATKRVRRAIARHAVVDSAPELFRAEENDAQRAPAFGDVKDLTENGGVFRRVFRRVFIQFVDEDDYAPKT